MNEERGNPASEETLGQWLRNERERSGLSIQKAAEDLHLDAWVIEAIEANRFSALGAPVFARGHLRKYAMLLRLPVEQVLNRYQAMEDVPAVADPIPAAHGTVPEPRRGAPRWLTWAVAGCVVAAAALWWWLDRAPPRASAPVARSVEVMPPLPPVEATAVPATAAAPPAVASAEPVVPAPTPSLPVVAGPGARLRLVFSQESWVEVYGADGRRLLYDVGAVGTQRMVTGAAPFRVVLGVASGATIELNDRPVALPPARSATATLRVSIAADGNVTREKYVASSGDGFGQVD